MTERATTDREVGWWPQDGTGEKIAQYLDRLRGVQTMKAFCQDRGLDAVAISQYRAGKSPRWQTIAHIAHCLGMTFGQFMVEALGAPPAQFTTKTVHLSYAIENDPKLSDVQRDVLRDLVRTASFKRLGTIG